MKRSLKIKGAIEKCVASMKKLTEEAEKRANFCLTTEEESEWTKLSSELTSLKNELKRAEELENFGFENNNPSESSNPNESSNQRLLNPDLHRSLFKDTGDFIRTVCKAGMTGTINDDRLLRVATGMNESSPLAGGFLVGNDLATKLEQEANSKSVIANLCWNVPVTGNSNGINWKLPDETSRVTGSRNGGIRVYPVAEAGDITASTTKFREIEIKLSKHAGACYLTEEMLEDSSALESLLIKMFGEEFSWQRDNQILFGTGVGMPLGIMNVPDLLITVSKEVGQPAGTIVYENIDKMWERINAKYRSNAVWLINQDCERQLSRMAMVIGTGGIPVFSPASASAGSQLFGRPVITLEQSETCGTTGDIILGDFSQYIMIQKQEAMRSAWSIHVRFLNDEQVLKFVLRYGGQPFHSKKITAAKGSMTYSPFVALQTRS